MSKKDASAPKTIQFPCDNCGALLAYAPGSDHLHCSYCDHETHIKPNPAPIKEYPFKKALQALDEKTPSDEQITTQCDTCAAEFTLDQNIHSGECPFCGTAIVTKTGELRQINPKSLVPFQITEEAAKDHYKTWLKRLWFAPSKLKQFAREETRLNGVYVPHWTYDSQTKTKYQGQRGDAYQVPQRVVSFQNGRRVVRTRMVTKIRWTPVSGYVTRFFDDVLIGASKSLPRTITKQLKPWDLTKLKSYNEAYLSGFQSEIYQVRLEEGYNLALRVMDNRIHTDVMHDIGGDRQRINYINTKHSDTTYKHILLPIWTAVFRFREKSYRFVVNGQSGKVQGERPYSWVKISAAVLAGLIVAGGLIWLATESKVFAQQESFELPLPTWTPSRW